MKVRVYAATGLDHVRIQSRLGLSLSISLVLSTISRELCRNRPPSGRYSPLHAAGAYQSRTRREAPIGEIEPYGPSLSNRLAEEWTPEQIAGWLKAGNESRLRAVGCEAVSDEEIQDIVITANLTPRKCRGFKTPSQAILKELGKRANPIRCYT